MKLDDNDIAEAILPLFAVLGVIFVTSLLGLAAAILEAILAAIR
jgi:hypothetical protein